MAQYTNHTQRTYAPDARGPQTLTTVGYTYTIARDGNTSGTNVHVGRLPAGAIFNPTACRWHIDEAFNGTTPGLAVFLVPVSTETIDGTAIMTTSIPTEGTTGIYRGTDAEFKTAGHHDYLTEDHEVIVQFTAGAADATTGKGRLVLVFDHDHYTGVVV